jgi:hypothetical protein
MGTPGIVMVSKFARPSSAAFNDYINYMDREEAVRNEHYNQFSAFTNDNDTFSTYVGDDPETLAEYVHYMANPYKTSHLFTDSHPNLDESELMKMKRTFEAATENGSVMWQDVFSFKNDWLIEHGYLDEDTHELDEQKIQDATRLAMRVMLEKEGMQASAKWTASIHYNTDNIHVHVATVEENPTRELITFFDKELKRDVTEVKGYRPRSTVKAMKRAFSNQLLGLQQERAKISELSSQIIVASRTEDGLLTLQAYSREVSKLIEALPTQKGYQKYGYAEKFGFKAPLDNLIETFIELNYPLVFNEIKERQAYVSKEEEAAFGDYKTSTENKLGTLYTRLGNALLNHVRESGMMDRPQKKSGISSSDELKELTNEVRQLGNVEQRIEDTKKVQQDRKLQKEMDSALEKILSTNRNKIEQSRSKNKVPSIPSKQVSHGSVEPQSNEKLIYSFQYLMEILEQKEDSYEKMIGQLDTGTKNFINLKRRNSSTLQSTSNRQRRPREIRVREKPMPNYEKQMAEWGKELALKRQLLKMQRVLRDETQSWMNERAYEQMINDIEYSN